MSCFSFYFTTTLLQQSRSLCSSPLSAQALAQARNALRTCEPRSGVLCTAPMPPPAPAAATVPLLGSRVSRECSLALFD
eukprot:scaffold309757_cov37-Tisochrysis_lutea.AAC.1